MPSRYVLDCSVTMAWFFEDEAKRSTDALFDALPEADVHVAAIWPIEVANVLTLAERKGRTSEARISQFIQRLLKQPITIDHDGLDRSFTHIRQLAKLRSLTTYDASYLELAIRRDLPLVTLDKQLIAAARVEGIHCVTL
ncbi:MAG: type II toxin-antitoxin system VapC family toxin [Burkholderiales bacterium]|nr:type II toxin-antitoxin system VapC family toxin [Phycisphaerae bacterium]